MTAEAILAMGCFWCAEADFEKLPGVVDVVSGYAGGHVERPTYAEVGTGRTGHAEVIKVVFDPARVTYDQVLEHFWRNVDPFDGDGQFCDQGSPYRPAILPLDGAQRAAAEASRQAVERKLGAPVAVHIEAPGTFWPAEGYHQDYARNNPIRYTYYRYACGRDARLAEVWKVR